MRAKTSGPASATGQGHRHGGAGSSPLGVTTTAAPSGAGDGPEPFVTVTIPGLRLVSEANVREHWAKKARRVRGHRETVVTLTRIGPGRLDGDNLQSACKAVRDGVADWLGVDDGDPGIEWRYAQVRGKRGEYAVRIEMA